MRGIEKIMDIYDANDAEITSSIGIYLKEISKKPLLSNQQ